MTQVNDKGYIQIQYDGDSFPGTYMYDPFLNGDVTFQNSLYQAEIEEILSAQEQKGKELIKSSLSKHKSQEKYYITKDNSDGTSELVYSLDCDRDSAFMIFSFVVREQTKECRTLHHVWRRVNMYETSTGLKIAQES